MTFSTGNIQGSYEWHGSRLCVVIEGSGHPRTPDGRQDWLRTNFFAIPLVVVHAGYAIAAYRVAQHLRDQIEAATSIVCRGHSLGGAVAEVLAVGLGLRGKVAEAHNYGGPKVWRGRLAAKLASDRADVTWYSAGNDVVPWIPPWFQHAGRHVHLRTGNWNPIHNHIHGYRW